MNIHASPRRVTFSTHSQRDAELKQIFDGQLIEEIIKLGALADILRLLRHGLTVGAKN